MRLTADLIQKSPQFLNPVRDRELDLRGHKIALIENLGVTRDAFDTIDLSDNEIRMIDNLPQLNRLKHLLLSNNRIEGMELSIASKLPNLESLVLSNNYFRELNQLEPLRHFRKLHSVSLLDNLVTKKENYRLFVIYHVPSLRYLDFIKVRQVERDQARSVFQHWKPSDSTTTTTPSSNSPFVTREMTVQRLTPQDMEKLKLAIANAKTYEEMKYYEQCLRSNQMPKELTVDQQQSK